MNLLVLPSKAVIVTFVSAAVCTPEELANTDCACGVADITTLGTAFLTLDKLNVSVIVLLTPSESVTTAVIVTVVEFTPSSNVLPFNVINPVDGVVDILAISDDVAVKDVMVKLDVTPLYVSFTTTVAFENESICAPVDLAVTLWSFGVDDIASTGEAFLFLVYVTNFVVSTVSPAPSLYLIVKFKEPLSASNLVMK